MAAPLNIPDFLQSIPTDPHRSAFPLTIATVDDEGPVDVDKELGPLINVTTHPEGLSVVCRVGMRVAGKGEAEYVPFVSGDEVLVAILQGNVRAGGVILCRLCNGVDRFPETVAGQSTANNAFAFTRSIAPHLEERDGPFLWRQSTTGAFVSIGAAGTISLVSGAKGALQLSADVLGMQSGDGKHLVQLDLASGRFSVQTGDALFTLSSSSARPEKSAVVVPGTLAISTAANPAAEHVLTTEAMLNVLQAWQSAFFAAWQTAWAAIVTPIAGAPLGPPLTSVLIPVFSATTLAAAVSAAASATQDPLIAAAIVAAFQAATQKPPAVPLLGQTTPGIGTPGTFAG